MPNETSVQRRRRISLQSGITTNQYDFAYICKKKPDRVGIICEGDSWFAYPRKWIAFGADINVVHHISDKLSGTDTANMLRLASNGDEAVNMTSGSQFKKFYKILKRNKDAVDLVLFSGGGNDIVGKDDMLPLLNEYQPGMDYLECINMDRLSRKVESILLAYTRLIELCADVVPQAKIVTHTYDIAKPWNQGAEFFWGLIKTKPWVYPYLVRRGIPDQLHLPIIKHILEDFADSLVVLSQKPENVDRLKVVQTQGTLQPGSQQDWLNEIHPTRQGFEKVTNKIYGLMRNLHPELPS